MGTGKNITIRNERPEEFGEIYSLVETAFKTAKVSDGDEQDFVDRLREYNGYIPELALVAEADGKLAGHIMLSRIEIVSDNGMGTETLMLAPLAVSEEYRNRGIGAALVNGALSRAGAMGYGSVFLAGDTAYYGRFGFRDSSLTGITNDVGIPHRYCLCHEIEEGSLKGIQGTVKFYMGQ